ncbi:MAG: tyrosine-type recombinase/integrase [Pseudobdellovibrionaceae bacterium]
MDHLPIKIEHSIQHMENNDLPTLIIRYFQEEVVGRSPLTLYARKIDLAKFCMFYQNLNGHLRAKELMPRDVKLFLNGLESCGYAANTINRHLGSIRAFGSWLLENGIVRVHPCRSIKDLHVDLGPPKAPRDKEYHRLRKAADVLAEASPYEFSQGFRNLTLLEALNSSGLRISEILSIELHQFSGRKLHNVHCKGGKIRSLSIRTEACDLISEYINQHRTNGSNFLFTSKTGQRLDRTSVWKALKKIARFASASLPAEKKIDLHPHMLRHRHGFKSREAKDAVFAAKRLGHSSLNFIQRYTQETLEEERDLLETMD